MHVGLNIPLRYIFKPYYSPHCTNTNVVGHFCTRVKGKIGVSFSNYVWCRGTVTRFEYPPLLIHKRCVQAVKKDK